MTQQFTCSRCTFPCLTCQSGSSGSAVTCKSCYAGYQLNSANAVCQAITEVCSNSKNSLIGSGISGICPLGYSLNNVGACVACTSGCAGCNINFPSNCT